jgi:CRISPR/Cas system-associated exonuclease Cas4 (RecB family)
MKDRFSRPHWSYSSISQFLRCPLQFYFERVVGLPRRSASDAQVLGSSVHAALALYHRRLQAGEQVPPGPILEAFHGAWDSLAGEVGVIPTGGKSLDDSRALGASLLEVYLKEPALEGILAVEQPVLAPVANSRGEYLERPLLVIPDLIVRDGDGTLKVNEIKTAGRSFSESDVGTSLQPSCYASALYELTGEEPLIEYVVLVKTKVPKVQRIETVRTPNDFGRLGDTIEAVGRAIDAGSFFPVESPMNCSGCNFFRECRGWTGPGSFKSEEHEIFNAEEAIPC